MNYRQAEYYLNSFIDFEKNLSNIPRNEFKLQRIRTLCDYIGNPQNKLKVVHVAGSKGKGSVCAMTASILSEAGYKVGLYTSPHIYDFRERIRCCHKSVVPNDEIFADAISKKELVQMVSEIKPMIEEIKKDSSLGRLTFYEVLTALAFHYFHRSNVDIAVIETGLGGRLDATNICPSQFVGISSLSLEHTHILGNTIEEIAAEKAAIIKESTIAAVSAAQLHTASEVVKRRATLEGIPLIEVDSDIEVSRRKIKEEYEQCSIKSPNKEYLDLQINLIGEHQVKNAALSIGLIEALNDHGFTIKLRHIQEGLKSVYWPARFEVVDRSPLTVLDSAHNPESAKKVVKTINELYPKRPVTLLLGLSEDKDVENICKELKSVVDQVVVTKSNHPRANQISEEQLQELFPENRREKSNNVEEGLELASEICSKNGIVLVTGSVFVVSEAKKLCIN